MIHLTLPFSIFLFLSPVSARLQKRDNHVLTVPLTIDANGRYTVGTDMSSGPVQSFAFALSTSSGYTAVAGTSCNSCGGAPQYNSTASPSAMALSSSSQNISFVGSSASGSLIKEDCAMRESNGSAWKYPNQTILLLNQSSSALSSDSSGIFGLATNRLQGNLSDTVIGGFFSRNPSKASFQFGMSLNPKSGGSNDGGFLHWTAPLYNGQITTLNVSTNANSSSEWTVMMNSWQFNSGGQMVALPGPNLVTVIDPYYPNLFIPQTQAQTIYAKVSGAVAQTPDSVSQAWTVPCDTKMSFATTFGTQTFILTESTLVVKPDDSSCVGAIEGWFDPNNSEYLFGSPFINQVYLIFTATRDGQNSIGFGKRGLVNGAHLSGGAIASIVLGVVIFVTAVSVGLWYFFYRSRRRLQDIKVVSTPLVKKEGAIQPYPVTPSSNTFSQPASPPSTANILSPASHTIPTMPTDGLYTRVPTSPGTATIESWEDTQQRVTMSVQRNEETLGRNVEWAGTPPPTFTEATSSPGAYRPPRWAKT